jgi:hypothetical protein
MERESFFRPIRDAVLKLRLEHAINSGNVDVVAVLSDKLGYDDRAKGMRLIETYGILVLRAKERRDQPAVEKYEDAIHIAYKQAFFQREI